MVSNGISWHATLQVVLSTSIWEKAHEATVEAFSFSRERDAKRLSVVILVK